MEKRQSINTSRHKTGATGRRQGIRDGNSSEGRGLSTRDGNNSQGRRQSTRDVHGTEHRESQDPITVPHHTPRHHQNRHTEVPSNARRVVPTSEIYDPFAHRNVEKPSGNLRSLANLIKSSCGSGILAMPLAFANAGWLLGTVSTFIIAFLCAHCVHIFVSTSRGVCVKQRKPLLSYAETCRGAFETGPQSLQHLAKPAFIFAEVCMLLTYIGVCCIFTVLIANSIKQPFDRYIMSTDLSLQYYCLIIIIPLCIMVQVKHLKSLAIFSSIANILLVLTFLICLYYIFGEKITLEDKDAFGQWSRYPAFLSTVIFAMEGIGVVMPIENVMKHPQNFLGIPSVLCIAMSIITFVYVVLGLFGYLRYGRVLRGSITLNLPIDDWPAVYAKFFIALSIFLTYPLHFFVVIDTLSNAIEPFIKKEHEKLSQIIIRIIIVLICGAIGIAVPLLEQIINLVGALFYSILGLIIPGVIETVYKWNDLGKHNWIMWKNLGLVVFGFFGLFSGCLVSILDMVFILKHGAATEE